ncbi:MAG: tetratricopeptide repeat protein [Myxococcales bacterium]|nr:tetratricopeptide repeat protein [Myxococcales bacterium]
MSINDSPNRLGRLLPLLLLAAVFAAYAPAIPGPYVWDDLSLIAQNPTLDDDGNLARYFFEDLGHFNQQPREMGFYRPLQALTFHLEVKIFGRNAAAQRIDNLLLHVIAVLALFGLARRLLRSDGWGFFAALLYAWHPLCTEQVCLIANRGGMLTGAFSLTALYCLARAAENRVGAAWHWYVLAGASQLAALLAKPEALVLVAPALAWLWLQPERPPRSRGFVTGILTGGLAALFAIWHWLVLGISHAHKAVAVPLPTRLLAVPFLTLHALQLSLLPVSLRAIRKVDLADWAAPSRLIPAMICWALILLLAWRLRRRSPAFAFATLLFAATMAPGSGVIALVRPVAEHYYYLPAAGACLMLAALFHLVSPSLAGRGQSGRASLIRCLAFVLAALFLLGTSNRATIWADPEQLWTDNVAKEPRSSEALNNLGTVAIEKGNATTAVAWFEKAVAANPANQKARLNLAHGLILLERLADAFAALQPVLQADPCQTKALLLLGRLLATSELPAARQTAEATQPAETCRAWIVLGEALGLENAGNAIAARLRYEHFLALSPRHPLAPAVRQRLAAGNRPASDPLPSLSEPF